jgi:hypothetical protein
LLHQFYYQQVQQMEEQLKVQNMQQVLKMLEVEPFGLL